MTRGDGSHREEPRAGQRAKNRALLLPFPVEVKGCDITEGMRLLSQTSASVVLVPAGCPTLCSECNDPHGPSLGAVSSTGSNRLLSAQLPVVTQGQRELAKATLPPTAST